MKIKFLKLAALVCLATMSAFAVGPKQEISFTTKQIFIDKIKLTAEIADTPDKSAKGLMFRKKMPDNHGMLFIFPDEQQRSFWMKNTFLPLSIGYFSKEKTLIDIQDMEPVKSEMEQPKIYPSSSPAKYALEVNQGWFKKNGIKIGAKLKY
jgi:uncharacterized membrane protein (UPF0127 family)